MKSLRESLFDDNVTKDMTFGDLFKLESYNIVKNITARGEYQDLSKSFSAGRIKKITKFSGTDKNETIYRGLVKIIQDIKLTGDPEDIDKKWMEDKLRELVDDLFQRNIIMKSLYVGFFNNDHICLGKDYTLFDHGFNQVHIGLGPDLGLVFRRK